MRWQILLKLINLNYAESGTLIIGRMRGYDVCIYASKLKYAAGLAMGISIGKNFVSGQFKLSTNINRYWADKSYYGPNSLKGLSRSFNASLLVGAYEHWKGLNDQGTPIWEDRNYGITIGIGLEGGFNYSSDDSYLIPLDFIFKNY